MPQQPAALLPDAGLSTQKPFKSVHRLMDFRWVGNHDGGSHRTGGRGGGATARRG